MAKKKATKRKKYSPKVRLVEVYYEDIEVEQPDGSVIIQKNVKIEKYATVNTLSSGAPVKSSEDPLDRLEGCDGYEDEHEQNYD